MRLCPLCNTSNFATATACVSCGAPLTAGTQQLPDLRALPVGTRLCHGAYSLGRVLGQGGFGITYQGSDTGLKRPVAVKEFFPLSYAIRIHQDSRLEPSGGMRLSEFVSARDKFLEEARVLARFSHPGIVNVHSAFEENNTAYMVMEMLRGQSLAQILEQRRALPENAAVQIIEKVARALEVVHHAGLLHRDIKPDNIIASNDGRVVLIDFGTAREFAASHTVQQTVQLTHGYAPLEQYTRSARFHVSTDIYALGATLYHLLTGELPAPAPDRINGLELAPPHQVQTQISRTVSDATMWALEVRAADRPQTMHDFLLALRSTRTTPRSSDDTAPEPEPDLRQPPTPAHPQSLAPASPASLPPLASPHDARLAQIAAQLQPLATYETPAGNHCPACRRPSLTFIEPRPSTLEECPVCRTGRLQQHHFDLTLCAVCRQGKLQEYALAPNGLFCLLCRAAPLREERRKRLGLSFDLWLICPHCQAEWDVSGDGTAQLVSAGRNLPAVAAPFLHQTKPLHEWKQLAGRSARCDRCDAQWYITVDARLTGAGVAGERLTLVRYSYDAYGVGRQLGGKTFPRRAWAKLAHDLPLNAGDVACAHCRAEFSWDETTHTLTLLWGGRDYPWAQKWQGTPVSLATWYLAADGKRSLQPGHLCRTCGTEFNMVGGKARLVRAPDSKTAKNPLHSHLNQAKTLADWHRLARRLPTAAEEKALREEQAWLQAQK